MEVKTTIKNEKKCQLMVRLDTDIAEAFKTAYKSRGQSVQFILERAVKDYIKETKELEESNKL